MLEYTIHDIARALGYKRSKDFLAAHGLNASKMSQLKARNPDGYVNKLKLLIINDKGLTIDDLLKL